MVVSDAFFHYRNIETDHPIGICENIYEALAAHERVRETASHVVPLYDPQVFERYPDGIVALEPTASAGTRTFPGAGTRLPITEIDP